MRSSTPYPSCPGATAVVRLLPLFSAFILGLAPTCLNAQSFSTKGNTNSSSALRSVVVAGTNNSIQGSVVAGFLGAGQRNSVQTKSSFASIVGGSNNIIRSNSRFAFIGGGQLNVIGTNAAFATIPGGYQNAASRSYGFAAGYRASAAHQSAFVWSDSSATNIFASSASNQFLIRARGGVGINTNNPGTNALLINGSAQVSGNLQVNGIIFSGTNNTTTGAGSVTGGGFKNTNNGIRSTIAGGSSNIIYSTAVGGAVGGGTANIITNNATNGTISGGEGNTLGGNYAFIGGGFDNGATGEASIASGGEANVASGSHATVSGGETNVASGNHATVPGGLNNNASGVGSFAAGVNAKVMHDYSFVWGGNPNADTVSPGTNTFTVNAPGGSSFVTGANASGEAVGVSLAANATAWSTLSDSNAKTAVAPVNHRETLRKVAALPVTSWRYKHDPSRRYIGPMAQDFRAAFGLGYDDKHISTLDTDGVTLSAIKGLVEELRDQDAVLAEREKQIQALERAVETMREELARQSF